MFSLWAMVRHVRQWFSHSVAVEIVVNGVLRTLWVIGHRVRTWTWVSWTAPNGMLAFHSVLWHAGFTTISSREPEARGIDWHEHPYKIGGSFHQSAR